MFHVYSTYFYFCIPYSVLTTKNLVSIHYHTVSFFFNKFLFIYFWLCWVFVAARGLSLVAVRGGYSSLTCTGFSLWWLLLLQSTGSRSAGFSSCGSRALERRLSSCGAWAYLLRGMWDPPRPGLKPVSPALAGGFLTTAPPGKPHYIVSNYFISLQSVPSTTFPLLLLWFSASPSLTL